eukprot:m.34813 g.34813  ORF g.34813 m.34813 type:complete len:533 (+) comp13127_c0_seq2:9-1607(+)
MFYCVRQAEGEGQNSRDEPLSARGVARADLLHAELAADNLLSGVDLVFVSPLSRALATASRALRGAPARLVLDARLREFNSTQTATEGLSPRNHGRTLAELHATFGAAEPRFVWPGRELWDKEWWTPQGTPADCFQRVQTFLRDVIWPAVQERQGTEAKVVVVAHENVFRVMLGVEGLANATWLPVHISLCALPKRGPVLVTIPRPMREHFSAAARVPRVVLSCLGCSLADVFSQRIYHTLDLARSRFADSLIVVSESCGQGLAMAQAAFQSYRQDRGLSDSDYTALRARLIVDLHAAVTEDNFDYTVARLTGFEPGSWTLVGITHDWHMPRSKLIYLSRKGIPQLELRFSSVPSHQISHHSDKHLGEMYILATRLGRGMYAPALWQAVQQSSRGDLQRAGARMRALAWSQLPAALAAPESAACCKQVRALIQTRQDAGLAELVELLCSAARARPPVPLALMPLNSSNGSTALHYAAECNAVAVAAMLLACFGATPDLVNVAGHTPLHFARTEEMRALLAAWDTLAPVSDCA